MLVQQGLKQTTRRTYTSAQKQYVQFCDRYKLPPVPCSEQTMLLYVSYLHSKRLKGETIKVYIAAVRALHIMDGYPNPLEEFTRLKLTIRGICREGSVNQKLPITFDILKRMGQKLSYNQDDIMIWSAMTLAYFGCLRTAEFTVIDALHFDIKQHLCNRDVTFSSLPDGRAFVQVFLKQTKTDKEGKGVQVYIGCTGTEVCAVCALQKYCNARDMSLLSPLFQFQDGTPLSRPKLVGITKQLIKELGLNPDAYSGHSYRSGSATTAAAAGFTPWEIKILGRWNSEAYHRYIRTPVAIIADFARRMTYPA